MRVLTRLELACLSKMKFVDCNLLRSQFLNTIARFFFDRTSETRLGYYRRNYGTL